MGPHTPRRSEERENQRKLENFIVSVIFNDDAVVFMSNKAHFLKDI